MVPKNLTIIGSNPPAAEIDELVKEALDHWPDQERPSILHLSADDILKDDQWQKKTRAAWIIIHGADEPKLFQVVGALQERRIPAMVTIDDEVRPVAETFRSGVVFAPTYVPPLVHYSMLRTLWHQSDVVRELQSEINVLRTHQGGLCDQMGKIDEELRLAAQLQREFLPSELPHLGDVEFKVLFRPAGYVSGDIYDVRRLDEHHVGFYLADAVGHGVPAALLTVFIKRSLPGKQIMPGTEKGYRIIPPDEALRHVNEDMLKQDTARVHIATACYGIINTQTLELSYARAGHPFPMILRADGTTDWLESEGGLLGVFPDETFELKKTQLRAGDRLVMYSDGFELAFPEHEEKGGEQTLINSLSYTEEFRDFANGSLQQSLDRFSHRLDQQAGSLNQEDDMTVMLMGVGPEHRAKKKSVQMTGASRD